MTVKEDIEAAAARENRLIRIAAKGAAGAAVGSAAGPSGALAGAGTGLVAGMVQELGDFLKDRRERRAQVLLESIFEQLGTEGPDGVRTKVASLREKPFLFDAVVEAFRKLDDALDDAVVPSLAALVAEYQNKRVDSFFRGVGRVLADLAPGELASLHMMLQALASRQFPLGKVSVFTNDEGMLSVHYLKDQELRRDSGVTEPLGCSITHANRVLYLLNAHGLAVGPDPSDGVLLHHETVQRMARLIRLT